MPGGLIADAIAFLSKLSMYRLATMGLTGDPIGAPSTLNPTLNQNIGKYNHNHIWDRVLFNTPGLRLGSS